MPNENKGEWMITADFKNEHFTYSIPVDRIVFIIRRNEKIELTIETKTENIEKHIYCDSTSEAKDQYEKAIYDMNRTNCVAK